MINGSTERYLSCCCGVRQGDPLFMSLFCIAEDYLSHLILSRVADDKLKLIYASRG